MKPLKEFVSELRNSRETSLIVIACSKNKRSDEELEEILNRSYNFEEQNIKFNGKVLKLIKNFQKCSKINHKTALNFSKEYPAYLRYKGRFYKAVWRRGGIKVWKKVVEDGWKVLILSAFYGFLRITDPIGNYDLRLSDLNNKCKKLLPEILKVIMDTHDIKKVYFLTSEEYAEPFRGKLPNLYRVILLDKYGKEIVGYDYKEYFSEAGELFAYMVYGGNTPNKTRYIELEEI